MARNKVNQKRDRRIFERIPVALPLTLINLRTGIELKAQTCDVSAKGLGILSNAYLTPWDRLELWLKMPDKKRPFYTRGSAIWTNLQKTGKLILIKGGSGPAVQTMSCVRSRGEAGSRLWPTNQGVWAPALQSSAGVREKIHTC